MSDDRLDRLVTSLIIRLRETSSILQKFYSTENIHGVMNKAILKWIYEGKEYSLFLDSVHNEFKLKVNKKEFQLHDVYKLDNKISTVLVCVTIDRDTLRFEFLKDTICVN